MRKIGNYENECRLKNLTLRCEIGNGKCYSRKVRVGWYAALFILIPESDLVNITHLKTEMSV